MAETQNRSYFEKFLQQLKKKPTINGRAQALMEELAGQARELGVDVNSYRVGQLARYAARLERRVQLLEGES